MKQCSDEELISFYRNSHDVAYAGELFLRYARLSTGVCLKYLNDQALVLFMVLRAVTKTPMMVKINALMRHLGLRDHGLITITSIWLILAHQKCESNLTQR